MKKLMLTATALIALAAATPALAQGYDGEGRAQASPHTGLYVGGFGGYDWSDVEAAGPDGSPDGWEGGVFVGYKLDYLMDRVNGFGIGMNAAVEAFYGWSGADDSNGGSSFEKDDEWGVSFRPGFSVVDNMTQPLGLNPYAILGYRSTDFETTAGGDDNFDGFELGIGTELVSYGNIGVRAEYSHTWYGSEGSVDPSSDDVRLGLAYHF